MARLSSLTRGLSLESLLVKATPIAEIDFPVLAFICEFSVSGSCGGETGTEVASVGGYVLGGEICEGLDAFVSAYRLS